MMPRTGKTRLSEADRGAIKEEMRALLRDLARHPPTLFPAVNTLYNAILEHPDFGRVDWSRLRVANSGGMAVQHAVAEARSQGGNRVVARPLAQAG